MKKILLISGLLTVTAICGYAQGNKVSSWQLDGNINNLTTNFLGTTDSKPIIFKTDNVERMRLSNLSSSLGIGLTDPGATLHLHYSPFRAPGDSIDGSKMGSALSFPSILRLSNSVTGDGMSNGFSIDYDYAFRKIYFKQHEQADFILQSSTGAKVTLLSDGNISMSNDVNVSGAFGAYSAEIYGSLKAQTATITGNTFLNGNVGVGTTTLAKKFNVQGDSYFNGKVGIGNANPQYQLDVSGSANFNSIRTNDIYIPGTEMKIRSVAGLERTTEDDPEGEIDDGLENIAPPVYRDVATFKSTGDVGIGTTIPQAKLDVAGSFRAQSATVNGLLFAKKFTLEHITNTDWSYAAYIKANREKTKAIGVQNANDNDVFIVWGNGVVNAKKLYAEKITVTMSAVGSYWYDHVFYPDYELRPLHELEHFIKENHHLPEIPSAKEVAENGIDLGDMQGKLLLKIEELTLYILDLQKQIDELKGR